MSLKIKKIKKPNLDLLLSLARQFNFDNISMSYYENIFTLYDSKELIGFINYCIIPSMAGKDRVYIRKLCYSDNKYIDSIIKTLCIYCRKKNLTIKAVLDTGKFNDECKKAFYDNDFKGEDTIYYLY
jgi:hypothetical protein